METNHHEFIKEKSVKINCVIYYYVLKEILLDDCNHRQNNQLLC